MGKSRNDWYGSVKGFIMRYYRIKKETEMQKRICDSVDVVLKDTRNMDNGSERIKAIEMILIDKTHTIDGVVLELHYSRRTVQSWISDFVKKVGVKSGF